jgi:hypothetical protein
LIKLVVVPIDVPGEEVLTMFGVLGPLTLVQTPAPAEAAFPAISTEFTSQIFMSGPAAAGSGIAEIVTDIVAVFAQLVGLS